MEARLDNYEVKPAVLVCDCSPELLKELDKGYDIVYVYCMAKSDFFGSSLVNDEVLYKYVYDYIGDKDGYDSIAFTRFYADTIAKGIPVIWEDMM